MSNIILKNITKTFKTKDGDLDALKNVNLTINSGEIYGIIGMSGAGKSTLVRCINLLEQPTSGEVLIDNKSLGSLNKKELRETRKNIGMIFQHFNLLMQKSVIDNVCFPLLLQGENKKKSRERAMELLKLVDLEDKAKAYPAQLSGGQRQRVAIARALATNPKILLCDEATSALDPQTTSSILDLLRSINEKFNITIVIITHEMAVVRKICTHVAIMKNGEVEETGTVESVFSHPKSKTGKELILKDSNEKVLDSPEDIRESYKLRIVFSKHTPFEPIVSDLVLTFNEHVNIIKANMKIVSGVTKGEMILGFNTSKEKIKEMEQFLLDKGLDIEEVFDDVE